jgi:hypothetical protein
MAKISVRVAFELFQNHKVEAIKLLQEETGVGLAEAKSIIEDYLIKTPPRKTDAETTTRQDIPEERDTLEVKPYTMIQTILGLGVFLSFMWMFVNSVILVASVLVMLNLDGYEKTIFTVESLSYTDDPEDGLRWSLKGDVEGNPARLADYALTEIKNISSLADIKKISAQKLRQKYPTGTKIDVLYNPDVTDTFFQNRSINIILYTPDLGLSEKNNIINWLKNFLTPFLCTSFLLFLNNHRKQKSLEGYTS